MEALVSVVKVGVEKLIELVPLWIQASAEKREQILAGAISLVDGLNKIFTDADARDDANTRVAREAIERSRSGGGQ